MALRSISDAQHDLITVAQARCVLGSASAALALANTGDWERVSKALFRRRGGAESFHQRCLAAVLDLGGDTVVSHRSALMLFASNPPPEVFNDDGTPLRPRTVADVHVSSTTTKRRPTELAVVHRVAVLPDRWRTIQRGIPVAAPALIAMQLFAVEKASEAAAVVDDLRCRGLVCTAELEAVVEELGERGRTGTGALRAYLLASRSGA